MRKAYSLLLSKGLVRIFLPLPATQLGSNPQAPRDYENRRNPEIPTPALTSPRIPQLFRYIAAPLSQRIWNF